MNFLKVLTYCLLISIITCTFASATDSLPESDHPYANNFEYTWPAISEPGATQMRLHFTKMDLAYYDKLILLDKDGNELARYSYTSGEDFWTDWYTGDTIKVRLETDGSETAYGFKIDNVETRNNMAPPSTLPESHHDYANNFKYTWPAISKPGATQMRLHFTKMDLAYYDKLILLDKDGNELARYSYTSGEDFWTNWYTGDTIKVRLETDGSETAYGFKIDNVETRPEKPNPPVANFSASPTSGNVPLNVTFTDKSAGTLTSWKWSFGDGVNSTIQNPTHKYSKAGNYTVALTASNAGGSNTVTKTNYIKVKPITKPIADFSASPTSGNVPLNVTFTDKSTGTPTAWKWTFGDGTNSTVHNPTHKYSKSGIYTVVLTSSNAGGSSTVTKSKYINVTTAIPKPVAIFTASPTSGNAPLKVTFTDKSTESPTSWKWDFGDGTYSTKKNPSYTYDEAGKYTVSLTVKNDAGSNTTTKTNYINVTTLKAPVAAFSASPTSGNAPLKVQFTDKSANTPTSWKWSFGDGKTSTVKNPAYTYSKAGNYTVSLTVKNTAGTNTKTIKNCIIVKTAPTKPVAAFSATPTSGKAPLKVQFTDKSTGSPTSWKWSFGDGKTSTAKSPAYTYSKAGKYTVSLTVKNTAGSNTKTMSGYIAVAK